jgi:hypothetical protein
MMKASSPDRKQTKQSPQSRTQPGKKKAPPRCLGNGNGNGNGSKPLPAERILEGVEFPIAGHEISVICLYPSVVAGKHARVWLETALRNTAPHSSISIEYFNYAVLNHDSISWEHVVERIRPEIILMVGDGNHMLGSGMRHSLRELLSHSNGGRKSMVIFRDLEPDPSINTRTLLDYVSALSSQNHVELNAVNGNGTPISCFRHPRLLLKTRRYRE